jgi:mannobiose 2-epimerase
VRLDDTKPEIVGPNSEKSQNTHIHILEAFTNLLRVWPDPGLRRDQTELLNIILDRIVDPSTHHLVLFMREDWTPTSKSISYGHDIELSWLVVEAAQVLGDPVLLARARSTSLKIAEATLAQGVDAAGGVYNEGDPRGVTDAGKEWWPQAEGAVGFLNAYQLSGDPRFLAEALRTWRFIRDKFVDRKNGDWYQTLDARNEVQSRPKVTGWKCPYHSGRSCMELIDRVADLSGGKH